MTDETHTRKQRRTERLRLVPVGIDDAETLFRLHQDPGIREWYGEWTIEDARERAAEMARGWQRDGAHKWLAYEQETGELIGRGGLSYWEVDGSWRWEVGWAVRQRFWGLGYATEIGRAGLELAFGELGADIVVAFTEAHNRRSRAVMQRLGFAYQRDIRHRGEPFVLYSLPAWEMSQTPSRH